MKNSKAIRLRLTPSLRRCTPMWMETALRNMWCCTQPLLQPMTRGETITEYSYRAADIYHPVNEDGIGVNDTADGDENVFVTAELPADKSYSHLHFGVWAGLGEADKDGSQKIADLGIGFVQSIGDGPTGSDMPNNGIASYSGNWAASVQEADPDGEGAIDLRDDDASVVADFTKGEIIATLVNLATLKGDITGNTFSGDAASSLKDMYGLDTEATFTGEFSGGFYGEKAAETAGIFDFSSADNEGGAFRGCLRRSQGRVAGPARSEVSASSGARSGDGSGAFFCAEHDRQLGGASPPSSPMAAKERSRPPLPEDRARGSLPRKHRKQWDDAEFLLTPPRVWDYTSCAMKPRIPRRREDTSGKVPYKADYADERRRFRT